MQQKSEHHEEQKVKDKKEHKSDKKQEFDEPMLPMKKRKSEAIGMEPR